MNFDQGTWIEMVRLIGYVWDSDAGDIMSEEKAYYILTEFTSFPYSDSTKIQQQLEAYFRSGSEKWQKILDGT